MLFDHAGRPAPPDGWRGRGLKPRSADPSDEQAARRAPVTGGRQTRTLTARRPGPEAVSGLGGPVETGSRRRNSRDRGGQVTYDEPENSKVV